MLEKLTEQEQKEYERLQKLERFWKLTWKSLPEDAEVKLEWFRKRLWELIIVSKKVSKEWNLDISQELKESREAWEKNVMGISEDTKENIIKAVDNIPVKVEVDSDGSRLIEFKLWDETYKILDPKLCNHTDFEYCNDWEDKNRVKLWWMRWDNVDERKNEKLKEYVREKQREWLYIPGLADVLNLLCDLWSMANLDNREDQIAMLIYLTWLDWCYWLAMAEGIRRSRILCAFKARYDCFGVDEHEHNNLLMMYCE